MIRMLDDASKTSATRPWLHQVLLGCHINGASNRQEFADNCTGYED